jgi:hypothetical protein
VNPVAVFGSNLPLLLAKSVRIRNFLPVLPIFSSSYPAFLPFFLSEDVIFFQPWIVYRAFPAAPR